MWPSRSTGWLQWILQRARHYGTMWECVSLARRNMWQYVIIISYVTLQGTKIFQYCTCPAGRVTYNFHSFCKHMHLSFKAYAIKNIRELYVIWFPWVILPKALVLQDERFGKNYSTFLDVTHNYKRTSGIFVPCSVYLNIWRSYAENQGPKVMKYFSCSTYTWAWNLFCS